MNPNLSDQEFIKTVLSILDSTARSQPAHFTSTKTRKQSFRINYPIPEEIEYEMASEV